MSGMYKDVPQMSTQKILQVTVYVPHPKKNFLKESPPMNSTSIANCVQTNRPFTGSIHQRDPEWELPVQSLLLFW